MPKATKKTVKVQKEDSYFDRLESDIKTNQSTLSLVLGALIIIVVGVLIFNYFNKNKADLGPAQQTAQQGDVTPENLPGTYTVKDGDTLFQIAQKYYNDGYQFPKIAEANKLDDVNTITTGQQLTIPKIEASTTADASPVASNTPEASVDTSYNPTGGTGGADTTIWGPKINGDTYTVAEGDWLSTIAGRAYGDILAYDKIAKANNITDPNVIEPGTILKLPR